MTEPTRRDLLRTGLAAAASSLASRTVVARASALLGAAAETAAARAPAASGPREQLLFDFGWKFFMGNDSNPLRDLDFGKGLQDFSKTSNFEFATAKFDDSHWRTLNLPHDWAVELPFVRDEELQSHGYKPLGRNYPQHSVGWYRRAFEIPSTDTGRRIVVEFDGIFRSALVFVNGCFIGRNDDGYAPFRLDLTDFLTYGGKNYLVVRVDASFGEGWFYEGAGIYRHVWLTKTDSLHLGQWESYVRTDVRHDSAVLSLGTLVQNQGTQSEHPNLRWQILDAEGKTVATANAEPQAIEPGGTAVFTATANLPAPRLWSPDTPYLYQAHVSVETDGKLRDAERVSFGMRTIAFDADKGFVLNGSSVKIKGTCNHQDHAGVGTALPDALHRYRAAVLRGMGSNAVRTSHNMPAPEWVAVCERAGLMMLCETRTMSSGPAGMAALECMVKRYRNSPAIILWSMGNEEWNLQGTSQGEHIVTAMIARCRELDPTRLCTAAVNGSYSASGIAHILPVQGFNYNLGAIDPYHRAHPAQPLIGTETASTLCTRGVYVTDKLRNWVSAYDVNQTSWSELAEEWWQFYATRDYLAGGFAWTGFDYRGEPTPYGWPSICSQFGISDLCGFPKDNYFYYQSWWGSNPVLHLFPHWNWEQRLGEPVSVWVHSNLEEVELFLNGKSQGSQKVRGLTHLAWTVRYEPGVIEARGRKGGKVLLTATRETTGAPAALELTSDRTEIAADGEDIALMRVQVLDSSGRPVPTASNFINFKIEGEGTLLGVGNGDPNCQESDKEPRRSLFNGLAQLIVQATRSPGIIRVEAYTAEYPGPRLSSTQLSIVTRRVALRPAV